MIMKKFMRLGICLLVCICFITYITDNASAATVTPILHGHIVHGPLIMGLNHSCIRLPISLIQHLAMNLVLHMMASVTMIILHIKAMLYIHQKLEMGRHRLSK